MAKWSYGRGKKYPVLIAMLEMIVPDHYKDEVDAHSPNTGDSIDGYWFAHFDLAGIQKIMDSIENRASWLKRTDYYRALQYEKSCRIASIKREEEELLHNRVEKLEDGGTPAEELKQLQHEVSELKLMMFELIKVLQNQTTA